MFLLVCGGVDSTVAYTLLNQVLGEDRVLGIHIDNGLMRQGESEEHKGNGDCARLGICNPCA